MRKKVMLVLAVFIIICTAMGTISVGAQPVKPGTVFAAQDYESEDSEFLKEGYGGLVITQKTDENNVYAEITATSDQGFQNIALTNPPSRDFVMSMDLCKAESPARALQFHVGPASGTQIRWEIPAGGMETGKWYSYLFFSDDGVITAYRKETESESSFEKTETTVSSGVTSSKNFIAFTFWSPQGAETDGTYATTRYNIDNFLLYDGTCVLPKSQKISISDEGEGKHLKATVDIATDAKAEENLTISPIVVLFDKKGKFFDWIPSTVNVGMGRFTVENTVHLSDSEYELVKDGTAELYLCVSETSYKPMMDTYGITIR